MVCLLVVRLAACSRDSAVRTSLYILKVTKFILKFIDWF